MNSSRKLRTIASKYAFAIATLAVFVGPANAASYGVGMFLTNSDSNFNSGLPSPPNNGNGLSNDTNSIGLIPPSLCPAPCLVDVVTGKGSLVTGTVGAQIVSDNSPFQDHATVELMDKLTFNSAGSQPFLVTFSASLEGTLGIADASLGITLWSSNARQTNIFSQYNGHGGQDINGDGVVDISDDYSFSDGSGECSIATCPTSPSQISIIYSIDPSVSSSVFVTLSLQLSNGQADLLNTAAITLDSRVPYYSASNVFPGATPAAVPIPAALPLFAGGLGLMGWMGRRRRGQAIHA